MTDQNSNDDVERAFAVDRVLLDRATELLMHGERPAAIELPDALPEEGMGAVAALEGLAEPILGRARDLGAPGFLAHMDPPTPAITWAVKQWTASRNQNLLHPDTSPAARDIERRVVRWLAPAFGMAGGHMTAGSTLATLTAIWAAREAGAHTVVSTRNAHISVAKAAHLLGMFHRTVRDWDDWVSLDGCVAVITAGVTSTGEIERLDAARFAAWRHIDAAWAGPLALSDRHRHLLEGIETADSVAVSAHKWLFQPKESALVLFADVEAAHRSVSFGADYLAVPNVGLLGSHGATAAALLATLLAYGRRGIAGWIDRCMATIDSLARAVEIEDSLLARTAPQAGVLNWRHTSIDPSGVQALLPDDVFVSATSIDSRPWLRSVGANPMADPRRVARAVAAL